MRGRQCAQAAESVFSVHSAAYPPLGTDFCTQVTQLSQWKCGNSPNWDLLETGICHMSCHSYNLIQLDCSSIFALWSGRRRLLEEAVLKPFPGSALDCFTFCITFITIFSYKLRMPQQNCHGMNNLLYSNENFASLQVLNTAHTERFLKLRYCNGIVQKKNPVFR